jgi:hypothetical protein
MADNDYKLKWDILTYNAKDKTDGTVTTLRVLK